MNRSNIHVTRTGVQIGGHYVPPPPMPSEDAEQIQRMLIDRKTTDTGHSAVPWVCFVCAVVLLYVMVVS